MFFGQEIQSSQAFPLSDNKLSFRTIQLTNVALSKSSQQADLYLRIHDKEILVCELNRQFGILQNSLNLLVDLKDFPVLISQNGNIHVCGYYQAINDKSSGHERMAKDVETVTNKKVNALENNFTKDEAMVSQVTSSSKQDLYLPETQKFVQQLSTSILSSRPSLRRHSTRNPQLLNPVTKISEPKQQPSKKQQKSQKKSGKPEALLSNGRYSLKALLENISDDEDDSDEEFQNDAEDQDSDDDSEFDEDEEEDEEQVPKKKLRESTGSDKNLKPQKFEEEVKERPKRQKNLPTPINPQSQSSKLQNSQKPQTKKPIEIVEESDDEKKQLNTEEFQEKWPQNPECHIEVETKREKIIEELASKMKVPTKRPNF